MKGNNAAIFITMGVSGCGKSTVGRLLADTLGLPFFDGDDYHSKANVAKMSKGNALNDDDRLEWLETLNQLAKENLSKGAVIGCSALKEYYRAILSNSFEEQVTYIYLEGSYEQIYNRMKKRADHFMPAGLLKSQFATLEAPQKAITVSITKSPDEIIATIMNTLGKK